MNTNTVKNNHYLLDAPVFLPDATRGVVRSIDANDLAACQIQAVMMNTYHLMQHPGSSVIHSMQGLHHWTGWPGPIFTDSGGFQAYSLIHQNPKFGSINEKGLSFTPEGSSRKYQLTPEKCIQLQMSYGSNVIICLDDCTHVDASQIDQEASVMRTINWARRGKSEFIRICESRKLADEERPKIFGVIQGGGYQHLRKICAESLLEMGFDGFGFGGWPLDSNGNLLAEIIQYVRALIPKAYPVHALGIGHPTNLVTTNKLGYDLFDSAMPTRDARHGRLYRFSKPLPEYKPDNHISGWNFFAGDWFDYIYIDDERHLRSNRPVSFSCDCSCCSQYSLSYLHHLYKINDTLYQRLATIHNLRFMTLLTTYLHHCALQDGNLPTQISI
jgi:queuine tRNA-ribosyltransferase